MTDNTDASGVSRDRALELVFAVNEIATNSIEHGGGSGALRLWRDGDKVVAEIRDGGCLNDPLADRRLPALGDRAGRGLWLANKLCDLVQVRSFRASSSSGSTSPPRRVRRLRARSRGPEPS